MTKTNGLDVDLVTGGAGFIGSHLVDRLISEGRKVRVVDDLSVGRRTNLAAHMENKDFEFIEGDVADVAVSRAACAGVDRVFHLAARADIVPSIQTPEPYFRANVDGTFAMVEAVDGAASGRVA